MKKENKPKLPDLTFVYTVPLIAACPTCLSLRTVSVFRQISLWRRCGTRH